MATLSEQQKDARERILVMALMSGLTASDLTSIGSKIKRQQERAQIESLSAQLHQIEFTHVEHDHFEAQHNGKTITAHRHKPRIDRSNYQDRERFDVKVIGPRGGLLYEHTFVLRDWEISKWPKKLMVKRDSCVTVLAALIHNKTIPT